MNDRRFIFRSALAVSLGLLAATGIAPAHAAPSPNQEALSRLGACISGGGDGDMLLLIDRSASLQQTDPKNERVNAAKYVVRQMSSVSQIYGWKINVAIAGFDTHYQRKLDWRALDQKSLGDVERVIEGFRNENHGQDTDYWQAVDRSRRDLNKRASGKATSCPFIVWFTDGEYSIEPRAGGLDLSEPRNRLPYDDQNDLATQDKANAAMAAGKKDLCRRGGVADQTRNQGITTLAIGLNGGGNPDFGLLKGIATGSGTNCGAITSPAPGAFFTAAGIDGLYEAFDQIAAPGKDPVVQESGVCEAGAICASGTHRFVLDGSIGSVHGLASTGAAGQKVIITSPSGKRVEFARSGQDGVKRALPGAELTGEWVSDRSVSFDLKRSSDVGWTGEWGIAFVAPQAASGRARSSLHLFGDLLPSAPGAGDLTFRAGAQGPEIKLGLARANGSAVDPASVTSTVQLGAAVIQDDHTVALASGLTKANLGEPIQTQLTGLTPGPALLRVTLDVTTTPWVSRGKTVPGTKLEQQARDYSILILPPGNYPSVPEVVDFGSTDKAGEVSAVLKLHGAGCAWLADPADVITSPDGVDVAVTSPANSRDSCASELPLALSVSQVGNGLVSGGVTVQTLPADKSGNPVPATVSFKLDMERPADVAVLTWVLFTVTLLGVAIPVGLLYILKFVTAVIPGESVASASIRGTVTEMTSFVAAGVPITSEDLNTSILTGTSRRKVAVAGGKTLVAKMGLAPTEPGYVVVEQPGIAAGGRSVPRWAKSRARLPLAVQGNWCVALDPVDPIAGPVEITVFTAAGGVGLPELLDDVRTNLGDFVMRLRGALPDQSVGQASTTADGWTSPATPSSGADEWTSPVSSSMGDDWTTPNTAPTWGSSSAPDANPAGHSPEGTATQAPAPADDSW